MNGLGFLTSRQARLMTIATIAGAVLSLAGLPFSTTHVWGNLLIAALFLVTLGLGGTLFVAFSYVTGAGWSVAFRRIPEAMAKTLVPSSVFLLAVLAAGASRYSWEAHGADPGTYWFKQEWLTPSFWLGRAVIYLAIWCLLAAGLVGYSRRQDRGEGFGPTLGNIRLSAISLVLIGISFTLASFDWLMALSPMWYSTVFAVYQFTGMIQAALAAMIILGVVLRAPGRPLHGVFTAEHLHDLSKLLLGFSCFWLYLWFSQFMLIWYTNIPEESSYFVPRMSGVWIGATGLSLFLNWILPFFVLLPRPAKRSGRVAVRVAVAVLVGRWLDLYWIVIPSLQGAGHGAHAETPWALPVAGEFGTVLLVTGLFGLLVARAFSKADPVPRNDPLLAESLHYHL